MNGGYWADSHLHPRMEKIMRTCIRLTFALALLCAAMSTAAFASSMYFIQGIPGRNYAAATDPAFPVDILLNDEVCYQHGLPFGVVPNPFTFFPGTYNVKVSIANTLAPCTNPPLVNREVTIEARTDMSVVSALNASGMPTLFTFTNNLTPVTANMARVLFAYAADGPAVQVVLQNTTTLKVSTYAVSPGALLDVDLPTGNYTVAVTEGTTTLVPATNITLFSQSVNLLYGIGQAKNNTLVLETRTLRDVI
jgi:hypothetical protein